jgi:hypothetical protein
MKTKISIITALLGFITNVATANHGSVELGYGSDFLRRGAQVSEQSLQASAALSTDLEVFSLQASAFTNKPTDAGADSYNLKVGASKQLGEIFNSYLGLEHFENVPGNSNLDIVFAFSIESALNPSVYIARDVDESLYTFEVGVGHSFDLEVVDLSLSALYGNTDTNPGDRDYFIIGAELAREISDNANLFVSADYVDSDDFSEDFVTTVGLSVNF